MEPLEFFLFAEDFLGLLISFLIYFLTSCFFFTILIPLVQPTPFARPNTPTNPHACFAYSPHVLPVAFARGRDICIHPTRPRLATCSNPPPSMVEKLYVTYNDVCIPYTP